VPDVVEPGHAVGKVALVTGGASGIGLAATRRFVRDGMVVVVGDVNDQALESVRDELGHAVRTLRCDVSQESDVEALASLAMDEFGRVPGSPRRWGTCSPSSCRPGPGTSSAVINIDGGTEF
jgi:NAD(P)-dependent dehydrogenase (short-subunit alcohol dehydrogenase family)